MGIVGEMYATGSGVEQDNVKAYAWLVLSGEKRELSRKGFLRGKKLRADRKWNVSRRRLQPASKSILLEIIETRRGRTA